MDYPHLITDAIEKARQRCSTGATDNSGVYPAVTQLLSLPAEYQEGEVARILFERPPSDVDRYITTQIERYREIEERTRPKSSYGSRMKELRARKPYERDVQHYANLLAAGVYRFEWSEFQKKMTLPAYGAQKRMGRLLDSFIKKEQQAKKTQERGQLATAKQAEHDELQLPKVIQKDANQSIDEEESVSLESDTRHAKFLGKKSGDGKTTGEEDQQPDSRQRRYSSRLRDQREENAVMFSEDTNAAVHDVGSHRWRRRDKSDLEQFSILDDLADMGTATKGQPAAADEGVAYPIAPCGSKIVRGKSLLPAQRRALMMSVGEGSPAVGKKRKLKDPTEENDQPPKKTKFILKLKARHLATGIGETMKDNIASDGHGFGSLPSDEEQVRVTAAWIRLEKRQLVDLYNKGHSGKELMHAFNATVARNGRTEYSWEEFKNFFESVNEDFLKEVDFRQQADGSEDSHKEID